MSSKPKGTWNYVPSENEQKDTWNSVSRPKTEQEVVANNTALEDWYRAQQNGDPNAGQYLLSASVAKADVDRWKNWREQNKTQLDTEYAFKGLDQDVLSLVRDKFKSQWGTKYYGAGYVQEESSYIMEMAFAKAVARGDNIIIPKIGGGSIVDLANKMKSEGYTVDLYYNEVSEATSIMRAASRFAEEGRYLALDYLLSIHNKPTDTFTKYAESGIFNYAEWRNNDVGFGEEPKLVWQTGRGRLASVLGDAAELERAVGRNASDAQRYRRNSPVQDGLGSTHSEGKDQAAERTDEGISKAPDDGAFFDALVGNDKPKYSAKSHGGGSFYDTMAGNDQGDRRAEYDAQQRAILSEWEGEGRAASLATSEKVFRNLAKSILQKASSRYSVDSFTDDLKALFHMVGDQARTETQRIARKVLNQSSERDDTMYDATYDARRYFRRGRFALSEKQKREVAIAYDGYNNYRRSLMGKLNIAKDGIPLDDAWGEICEMFPGYFEEDTKEGDQPQKVKEFLDAAYERPYINPYGTRYNIDDAASELADELLAAFSNIRQRKPAESRPDKEGEPDKERETRAKTPGEKAEFSFERPTTRQGRLQKAWELYDNNMNPQKYYEQSAEKTRQLREMKLFNDGKTSDEMFDLKTNNLLRGLMLRNGENVGGALADNSMQRVTEIFSRAKKRLAAGLTLSSPVRVFEDVTGWGGSTAEERANNIKDGNFLKNTYYEYGNVQAANREAWIAEKMRPVMEAIAQNGDYGVFESAVTQMLGEEIITKAQAENAVCDGKTMIIEAVDGVFVLDGKGRMLYSSDSRSATHYIDMPIAKRAESAIRKKSKGELAKHVVKRELPPLKVVRDGNTVTVKKDNGEVVAQVAGGTKPNMQAVHAAVDALRTFYADAYKEIAAARVENGYAPPGYIENYFPHQSRTYDGIEGFIEAMTANDLPTAINGRTGMFSPGQPWNANLQSRLGEFTEFDAVRGFNRYVKGAGDTIFYTPVIQRLRQLEKAVRMLDETQLTAEGQKRNSAFADWVHEYANEWANKKASFDREVESLVGREGYSVSNMLTGLVSASAVGGNISSALSNIISGLTGYAQVDGKHVLKEVIRTIGQLYQANSKNGQYDGFVNEIPFLQRRFSENEDILLREVDKFKRKGSKAMYCLFSALDRFSVESVARAKYAECIERGMTKEQAIEATNDLLIKNFADRGKGQAARIFNVKWLKPVAQFQLEVLNQMNHFRDMNRAEVEAKLYDLEKQYANGIPFDEIAVKALSSGGMRKLKKVMEYLVLLSLWGMVTRALMGRDQTWNPAGMAMDAVDDFREGGMKQVAAGIGETLTENVPFVSMLTEGGRVPLAGNITNVTDIIQAIWNDETDSLSNADWIKGATSFVPGGGQLRKIITGIEANTKGGSYTDKGNLRYPIEQKDYLKSALFGPSAAAPRGYEWGDTLSAKETEAYEALTDQGLDGSDLYDTLVNMNTVTGSKSEKALSLLANRNDFDDEEVDMIAAALGIEYKGSLESYAEKSAEKYLKDKRKDLKDGEITKEKYDEIESVFDEYFRLLGMAN